MGSLAGLLKARGLHVTGSDTGLYPPMSTLLEQWEISVDEGFRAEHVLAGPPDLVVIGNAVRPDNPEARAAIDEGLRYLSFPDALYELAIPGRHSVVVSGTHGKTTTTCLVSALPHATGHDPSLLVGGHSLDFDGSFREGQGVYFVVEGDEYDTAFFDKTPKFLHYRPRTLIVTSVEFDHADIYRDLDHVKSAFRSCVEQLPADGVVVAAVDHPNVLDVIRGAPCPVVGYGASSDSVADWQARDLRADQYGTSFDNVRGGATRSMKSVVVSPARNSGVRRVATRKSRFVATPPRCARSRPSARRPDASLRGGACAITFASMGSKSVPITEPRVTPESHRSEGDAAGS